MIIKTKLFDGPLYFKEKLLEGYAYAEYLNVLKMIVIKLVIAVRTIKYVDKNILNIPTT